MNWPCLVLKKFCKTQISLKLEKESINEYGEPLEPIRYCGKCNYQEKAKRILTDQKKIVEITGVALFPGDICPSLPVISGGTAIVHGMERRIARGAKIRNPDGTVNYTEVLLE